MATLTTREGPLIESELNSDIMPEFDDDEDPEFFQLRFQDGQVINESESMEDFESEVPTLGDESMTFGNIGLEDGDPGRFILLRTKPIEEVPDEEEEEAPDEEDVIFEIPEGIDANEATVTFFLARSREPPDPNAIAHLRMCRRDCSPDSGWHGLDRAHVHPARTSTDQSYQPSN